MSSLVRTLERTTRAIAEDAAQRANSVGNAGATILAHGTVTLVAGLGASQSVPAIKSTSQVYYSLRGPNASTALGVPTAVVTPGTGFTTDSLEVTTPGSTQTGDVSTYNWFVVE